MEAAREALSLAWVEADTDCERFEAFRSLGKRERADLLAYVAAATLIDSTDGNEDKAIALFAVESGWTVRHHWTPTGKNYFARLKRDRLMAFGCEWYGESFADNNASTAKKSLVEKFDMLFNGDVDEIDEKE